MAESQGLARDNLRLRDDGFAVESEAALEDAVELDAFVGEHAGRGKRCECAADFEERGDAGGGVLWVERAERGFDLRIDGSAAGNAVPCRVDTVENVGGR